jgi:hypothetical protein
MRGAISRSAMTGGTLRAIGSVAHAPQLEGVLIGGGFFLSSEGNDMAKCQRTKSQTLLEVYTQRFLFGTNVILRAMYDLSSSTGSQ